jgi:hypothetical protein
MASLNFGIYGSYTSHACFAEFQPPAPALSHGEAGPKISLAFALALFNKRQQ